jgi:putative RNA 2'-phosphotransferase
MPLDYKQLSKTVSHALRHAPALYKLELDEAGWVPVEALLVALRSHRREWQNLRETDLITMMDNAQKHRFELVDGKIRAYYGHSVPQPILRPPVEPPSILYHGTAPESAAIILEEGLKSMNRQHVHLSTNQDTARMVGARHTTHPVMLEIQALEAHRAGIAFYLGNEDVWLAEDIPPDFIKKA